MAISRYFNLTTAPAELHALRELLNRSEAKAGKSETEDVQLVEQLLDVAVDVGLDSVCLECLPRRR